MHVPMGNYFAAVAAAKQKIDAAKADDGKIDAGEAFAIAMAFGLALLAGTPILSAGNPQPETRNS